MTDLGTEKSTLRPTIYSFLERGVDFILGFGTTMVLMRHMTVRDFGLWVLFLGFTSVVEVSIVGIINNGLVKYLAGSSSDQQYGKIITASTLINIVASALLAVTLYWTADFFSQLFSQVELGDLLKLYSWIIIFCIPFFQCKFIQQANLSFRGIFWANNVRKGLFFFFVLISYLLQKEFSLMLLGYIYAVGVIAGSIVSYIFSKQYLKFSSKVSKHWVGVLIKFGVFAFGTNLSTMLYKVIDKFILGALMNTITVGLYEMAIRITNLVQIPVSSFVAVSYPRFANSKTLKEKESIKSIYEKVVGQILGLILPFLIILFIFPSFFIKIISGENYQAYLPSIPVLRLTLIYCIFIPYLVLSGAILDATGHPKTNFYYSVFGLVINIIANYIFILEYGILGAAYGTIFAYSILFILHLTYHYRYYNIKIYRPFIFIVPFYKDIFKYIIKALKT